MKTEITYKSFFAYSEEKEKCFYTTFTDGINIVTGKNTSGKSTLLQAMNYTFGINDEKYKLKEILSNDLILRIDIEIKRGLNVANATIIRYSDCIYIKEDEKPILRFYGIKGNNSNEHRKLKEYYSNLFNFNLELENNKNISSAPIEVMFLPYYVSQNYGWVLILKSFSNLEYYKNFKTDYYDYYLGINKEKNRKARLELEAEKNNIKSKILNLKSISSDNDSLPQAILLDEEYIEETQKYFNDYKEEKTNLITLESEFMSIANKIAYLERQKKTLKNVKSYLNKNTIDICSKCNQKLVKSIEEIYEYYQDKEDTNKQLKIITESIIKETKDLNSKEKKINELRNAIYKKYNQLKTYKIDNNFSIQQWIETKADIEIHKLTTKKITKLEQKITLIEEKLSKFLSDEDIATSRKQKEKKFKSLFYFYLKILEVNTFNHDYSLYKLGLFPQQGVELLKALLAYYFAFNKLIMETSDIHRLPLVLDAVFKEDVDEANKHRIIQFISEYFPSNTQLIFSIAESIDKLDRVNEYNKKYFQNKAKIIMINKEHERAFLVPYNEKYNTIKEDTCNIIYN